MTEVFPDFIRCIVSNVMFSLMIFSLARPKGKKNTIIFVTICICIADLLLNSIFYLRKQYWMVVYIDIFVLIPALILAKSFFYDTFNQWFLNVITALNTLCVVRFLDGEVFGILPYKEYSVTIARAIILGVIVWLFFKKLRPHYILAKEHCGPYLIVSLCIFASYGLLMTNAISLTHYKLLYSLLSIIAISFYISLFWSLKDITEKYILREENIKIKADELLLRSSTKAMQQSLALMEESTQRLRILNHDQRHINITLLEFLQSEKIQEAINFLKNNVVSPQLQKKNYCCNTIINSITSYYISLAKASSISCKTSIDLPETLLVDSFELAMTVSNILENAIQACKLLPVSKRWIRFCATYSGQLLLSISNSCVQEVKLSKDGFPVTLKDNHGIGTKSILAFVNHQKGEVIYDVKDGVFCISIII